MIRLRLLPVGLVALAPLLRQPVAAQALDPTFPPPTGLYTSGTVYTMGAQQADGKRVVAGSFLRANGSAASNLLRLDAAGAVDAAFGQNVGNATNISTVRLLPNGQYLLGTSYNNLTAGGLTRPSLLRLNANGTADAAFNAGSGIASAGNYSSFEEGFAVQPDGKIVVVGEFDSFNGRPAAGVVRLNADGSVDTGFSVGKGVVPYTTTNNYVDAVTVQPDGKLLVSGTFATFNGQPANGLVRLNADGSVDTSFSSPLATTSEATGVVLQPDGKLLVTGNLLVGSTTPGIVRLNPNGSVDAGFVNTLPSFSTFNLNDPSVVVQPDGKILVVGNFQFATNIRVARLNPNGTLDTSFQVSPGASTPPNTLGLQADGSVLVGGNVTNAAGAELTLARLTSTGAVDPAFAPRLQLPGYVQAVVRQPDGQLILGGNFTELNGQPVQRLARLSATGVLDAGFTAAAGVQAATVNCLALQPDGRVLAGTTTGLVRLAATGAPDASFTPLTQSFVRAVALQSDGRILVGGNLYGSSVGNGYNGLVRLTSAGAVDPSFIQQTLSNVGTLSGLDALLLQADGRLVVSGRFFVAGLGAVYRVVRYQSTGTLDATFNNELTFTSDPNTNTPQIYSLVQQPDGKLLIGGSFSQVSGSLQPSVARLTTTGTPDGSFAASLPASATALSLALQPNGRILVGGSLGTSPSNYLTRLLPGGQTDNTFAATAAPNASVYNLLVQPDGAIVLAGYFTAVGSQAAFGVARITAPNVLAVAAPTAVAARTEAWPVPAHSVLHVAPDLSAHPLSAELLDALGRPVRQQAMGSSPELALSVESLPPGVYLLRVHYAAGAVVRHLAVE